MRQSFIAGPLILTTGALMISPVNDVQAKQTLGAYIFF